MASGSFNLTRTGSTSSYITFKCNWSSTVNQTANTSTVTVTVIASKSSSSTASTYGNQSTTVKVDSASQSNSGSFTLAPSKTITLFQKSFTVKHNANGSKSVKITVNVGGNIIYANGSATVTLDTIPRYASITQSLSAKTETTATIKWVSDATVDYLWYSTNNGSSWTGLDVADGATGSYTISGLSEDTTYQIKTRVRRKDSQLKSDSSSMSVKTYDYPYANSMPNFTIGERFTIGLYNPLKRSVTVNIIGEDESQISNDTTTGTSITGYNGATVVNRLYASIPNSINGTYKVKVSYGTQITTKVGGLYTVNENDCRPNIGNITYEDTNNTAIAITGNNQDIVRNQSIVRYRVDGLSAQKSATVASCSVKVNGNNYNLTISGNIATGGDASINSGSDIEAVVTVTDSRGVKASKNVTIHMIDWQAPTALINMHRLHNYYSETDITVDADYASINGNNQITITYEATKEGDSTPSVTGYLQDNTLTQLSLDNRYSWSVAITLVDSFNGRATYTVILSEGIPLIFFDRLNQSVGVNCFPKDRRSLEVNGVNVERSVITRSLSDAITNLTVNTYTIIPLDLSNVAGSKLSVTNNGGIKIGANISKVLVSGRMFITSESQANRHIRICKNSYSADNTIGWMQLMMDASERNTLLIPPLLASVTENDVIYIMYYVPVSTDKIWGDAYGSRTSLTVETVA